MLRLPDEERDSVLFGEPCASDTLGGSKEACHEVALWHIPRGQDQGKMLLNHPVLEVAFCLGVFITPRECLLSRT